ncbi:hypothetical protein TREES_T100010961 [Tupaia chinensis]|uniref:Uncharacterized protein n=1 Tax=Tupaia chinensis TaxID=246437 RepID=L9JFJ4_TUPCH|nr:hypothetical protein TREES_T100010961 [Tupaia chinensis]
MHTPAALAGKSLARETGYFRNWDSGVPGGRRSLTAAAPRIPFGVLEHRQAGISLPSACGLGKRELAFPTRRSCHSAQLESSAGFRIQRTLAILTRQPVCAARSCGKDRASSPRACERFGIFRVWAGRKPQGAQPGPGHARCLGSSFDTERSEKTKSSGLGDCGVPARLAD